MVSCKACMTGFKTIAMAALLVGACAPKNPGHKMHDMSAASHDAAAQQRDAASAEHAAQFDAAATATQVECIGTGRASVPCWTMTTNPTQEHLRLAEKERQMAAQHRAASGALLAAESTACVGISDDDRDISPFDRVEDIASVEPLTELRADAVSVAPRASVGSATTHPVTVGAVVEFRAVPGLTSEYLQRTVECHLARNAALGHIVPEMPNCPLVPTGASALVSSTGTGFTVAIRSDDAEAAADILARAERLVEAKPTR